MSDDLDEGLQRLLLLIRGGLWPGCRGITTYPNYPEDRHRLLHGGCLELERRGLIRRKQEEDRWIFWEATSEAEGKR